MRKYLQLLFLILVSIFLISCKNEEDTPNTIALEATPSTLSFGDTNIDGATQSFTIYNKGNVSLDISNIKSSNPNYYVDWDSGTIGVNSSQKVNVDFYPTTNQQQNGQITISSNAPETKYVTVSGKGSCNGYGVLEFENRSSMTHKVMIDNIKYGELAPGQTGYYDLAAGVHSIAQPRLDGTGGCISGNVTILECGTSSYYCQYD